MTDIFKKLFGKKEPSQTIMVGGDIQTTPLTDDQLKSVTYEPAPFRPQQYLIGCGQSNGLQRDHNEDTIYSLSSVIADGENDFPFGICIVADGMGGHLNGEKASRAACRSAAKYLVDHFYSNLIDPVPGPMEESLQEIMEQAVREAQKCVLRNAPGGGTTITCSLMIGNQVTIGHVGDSRAYFIYPDGRIQRITKDHSLVQRMIELDEISEEEALVNPNRNVLLKALGQSDPIRPDIQTHQIPRVGYMMLCSDGLWGVVPDTEIYRMITGSSDPTSACNKLINAANDAGGPDNISVILVQFLGQ